MAYQEDMDMLNTKMTSSGWSNILQWRLMELERQNTVRWCQRRYAVWKVLAISSRYTV